MRQEEVKQLGPERQAERWNHLCVLWQALPAPAVLTLGLC